eukprot:30761-Pelagococcus_subviridis.AAC.5
MSGRSRKASGVESKGRRRGGCFFWIETEGPWAERNAERKSLRNGEHNADAVVWEPRPLALVRGDELRDRLPPELREVLRDAAQRLRGRDVDDRVELAEVVRPSVEHREAGDLMRVEGPSFEAMTSGWSSKASEAELKGNAGGD